MSAFPFKCVFLVSICCVTQQLRVTFQCKLKFSSSVTLVTLQGLHAGQHEIQTYQGRPGLLLGTLTLPYLIGTEETDEYLNQADL